MSPSQNLNHIYKISCACKVVLTYSQILGIKIRTLLGGGHLSAYQTLSQNLPQCINLCVYMCLPIARELTEGSTTNIVY